MIHISNFDQLIALAESSRQDKSCNQCCELVCPGWESMPSTFQKSFLEKIGSLRSEESEPTLDEFHPKKTHIWSVNAPIAIDFHPYNLCDLYRCTGCSRLFLRYTEYGGYYEDERIRVVDPELVV